MAIEIFVDEFLYRGRSAADPQPPAWHVALGVRQEDGFGGYTISRKMFSVAQAEAEGYPLPALLAKINAETLVAHEALTAAHADLEGQLKAAQGEAEAVKTQLAAERERTDELSKRVDELNAPAMVSSAQPG